MGAGWTWLGAAFPTRRNNDFGRYVVQFSSFQRSTCECVFYGQKTVSAPCSLPPSSLMALPWLRWKEGGKDSTRNGRKEVISSPCTIPADRLLVRSFPSALLPREEQEKVVIIKRRLRSKVEEKRCLFGGCLFFGGKVEIGAR